jgi:hypothetical protein
MAVTDNGCVLCYTGSHGVGLSLVKMVLANRPKRIVVIDLNPVDFKHGTNELWFLV